VAGWGYTFGDEGSGFDIARQALRAALRFEEGWGEPTDLHRILLEATASKSANEVLHRFYSDEWPRSRVATLAKLVDAAATAGDGIAQSIMDHAGRQLASLAEAVWAQLWSAGDAVRLAYVGGVFRSGRLRSRFREAVESNRGITCGPPVYGPAAGALLEAWRAAGLHPELKDLPELKS
jgi:N-acetylglucosamine kinase-like BadF-type ATPase